MNDPKDPEHVLHAFAIESTHDSQTLEQYLRRYPELAEELIDLSFELRFSDLATTQEPVADPGAEEALQEFLAHRPRTRQAVPAADPFERFREKAFGRLAEAMCVPRMFLTPFRDAQVAASSVPDRFLRRLARAMDTSVESLRQHLRNPRMGNVVRAFKSAEKPTAQEQTTFRRLLEQTPMSDEQRRALREDLGDDGLL